MREMAAADEHRKDFELIASRRAVS